jgi:hypothetical protein
MAGAHLEVIVGERGVVLERVHDAAVVVGHPGALRQVVHDDARVHDRDHVERRVRAQARLHDAQVLREPLVTGRAMEAMGGGHVSVWVRPSLLYASSNARHHATPCMPRHMHATPCMHAMHNQPGAVVVQEVPAREALDERRGVLPARAVLHE